MPLVNVQVTDGFGLNDPDAFDASVIAADLFGGGLVGAGGNGIQGWVQSAKPVFGEGGGLTVGSAALFSGISPTESLGAGFANTFAEHEFGHTLQFIGLSAISGAVGSGTVGAWGSYLGLGALGTTEAGTWWEGMATNAGAAF